MFLYRLVILTLFLFNTSISHAEPDSISLKLAVGEINEYLLKKDTASLKTLIANTLTYGHSNGWIQNNQSLLTDLYNGKINYTVIDQEITRISFEKNTAAVRATANVEGLVDGNPFVMKLHILQVWMDVGKSAWKLIARQSVKLL